MDFQIRVYKFSQIDAIISELALEAKPHGRRYSAESMMNVIDLYMRSRNTEH